MTKQDLIKAKKKKIVSSVFIVRCPKCRKEWELSSEEIEITPSSEGLDLMCITCTCGFTAYL